MTDTTTVIISVEDRLKLAELTGELAKLEVNLWIYVLAGAFIGLFLGLVLGGLIYLVLYADYNFNQHKMPRMVFIAFVVLSVVVAAVIAVYMHSAEMNSVEAQIEMIKQIWGLT